MPKSSESKFSAAMSVGIGIGAPIVAFTFAALVFALYSCTGAHYGAMDTEDLGLLPPVEYEGKRIAVVRSLIAKN
jgi:hypothetical protein